MNSQTVVIRLELHLTDDAMTGRATDSSGTAKEFASWLGLLGAIDALVPGSRPVPAAAMPPSASHGGASS